jgi:hypothetical protein
VQRVNLEAKPLQNPPLEKKLFSSHYWLMWRLNVINSLNFQMSVINDLYLKYLINFKWHIS